MIAPHPDDETLGAGALIAQVTRERRFAGLVYLTDGSGSHDERVIRRGRLIATRQREGALALRRLGGAMPGPPIHLSWGDANPANPGDAPFERARRRIVAICRARRVDILAVTAAHEPHCDHAAAACLAYAVQRTAKRPLRVCEYLVWAASAPTDACRTILTAPLSRGTRRHALSAHRSQLTQSYGDGFRLAPDARRMPARDILYLRKAVHGA